MKMLLQLLTCNCCVVCCCGFRSASTRLLRPPSAYTQHWQGGRTSGEGEGRRASGIGQKLHLFTLYCCGTPDTFAEDSVCCLNAKREEGGGGAGSIDAGVMYVPGGSREEEESSLLVWATGFGWGRSEGMGGAHVAVTVQPFHNLPAGGSLVKRCCSLRVEHD